MHMNWGLGHLDPARDHPGYLMAGFQSSFPLKTASFLPSCSSCCEIQVCVMGANSLEVGAGPARD